MGSKAQPQVSLRGYGAGSRSVATCRAQCDSDSTCGGYSMTTSGHCYVYTPDVAHTAPSPPGWQRRNINALAQIDTSESTYLSSSMGNCMKKSRGAGTSAFRVMLQCTCHAHACISPAQSLAPQRFLLVAMALRGLRNVCSGNPFPAAAAVEQGAGGAFPSGRYVRGAAYARCTRTANVLVCRFIDSGIKWHWAGDISGNQVNMPGLFSWKGQHRFTATWSGGKMLWSNGYTWTHVAGSAHEMDYTPHWYHGSCITDSKSSSQFNNDYSALGACSTDPLCVGVQDTGCNGTQGYRLCRSSSKYTTGHCVRMKIGGSSTMQFIDADITGSLTEKINGSVGLMSNPGSGQIKLYYTCDARLPDIRFVVEAWGSGGPSTQPSGELELRVAPHAMPVTWDTAPLAPRGRDTSLSPSLGAAASTVGNHALYISRVAPGLLLRRIRFANANGRCRFAPELARIKFSRCDYQSSSTLVTWRGSNGVADECTKRNPCVCITLPGPDPTHGYYAPQFGKLCPPQHAITTETSCAMAGSVLNYPFDSTVSEPDRPPGCIWDETTAASFLNVPASQASRRRLGGRRLFTKAPSKSSSSESGSHDQRARTTARTRMPTRIHTHTHACVPLQPDNGSPTLQCAASSPSPHTHKQSPVTATRHSSCQ